MNSSTKTALLRTINRTEIAFRKGSRNKFENRLPVFVSLQRKALRAGFSMPMTNTLEGARKLIGQVKTHFINA